MKIPGADRVWDLAFFRSGVKANRKVRIHRGRSRWGTFIIPRKEAD